MYLYRSGKSDNHIRGCHKNPFQPNFPRKANLGITDVIFDDNFPYFDRRFDKIIQLKNPFQKYNLI